MPSTTSKLSTSKGPAAFDAGLIRSLSHADKSNKTAVSAIKKLTKEAATRAKSSKRIHGYDDLPALQQVVQNISQNITDAAMLEEEFARINPSDEVVFALQNYKSALQVELDLHLRTIRNLSLDYTTLTGPLQDFVKNVRPAVFAGTSTSAASAGAGANTSRRQINTPVMPSTPTGVNTSGNNTKFNNNAKASRRNNTAVATPRSQAAALTGLPRPSNNTATSSAFERQYLGLVKQVIKRDTEFQEWQVDFWQKFSKEFNDNAKVAAKNAGKGGLGVGDILELILGKKALDVIFKRLGKLKAGVAAMAIIAAKDNIASVFSKENWEKQLKSLSDYFDNAMKDISKTAGKYWDEIKDTYSKGSKAVSNLLDEAKATFSSKFSAIADGLTEWKNNVASTFDDLGKKIPKSVADFGKVLEDFKGNAVSTLKSMSSSVADEIADIGKNFGKLSDYIADAAKTVGGKATSIASAGANILSKAGDAAAPIMKGVGTAAKVVGKAAPVVGAAYDAINPELVTGSNQSKSTIGDRAYSAATGAVGALADLPSMAEAGVSYMRGGTYNLRTGASARAFTSAFDRLKATLSGDGDAIDTAEKLATDLNAGKSIDTMPLKQMLFGKSEAWTTDFFKQVRLRAQRLADEENEAVGHGVVPTNLLPDTIAKSDKLTDFIKNGKNGEMLSKAYEAQSTAVMEYMDRIELMYDKTKHLPPELKVGLSRSMADFISFYQKSIGGTADAAVIGVEQALNQQGAGVAVPTAPDSLGLTIQQQMADGKASSGANVGTTGFDHGGVIYPSGRSSKASAMGIPVAESGRAEAFLPLSKMPNGDLGVGVGGVQQASLGYMPTQNSSVDSNPKVAATSSDNEVEELSIEFNKTAAEEFGRTLVRESGLEKTFNALLEKYSEGRNLSSISSDEMKGLIKTFMLAMKKFIATGDTSGLSAFGGAVGSIAGSPGFTPPSSGGAGGAGGTGSTGGAGGAGGYSGPSSGGSSSSRGASGGATTVEPVAPSGPVIGGAPSQGTVPTQSQLNTFSEPPKQATVKQPTVDTKDFGPVYGSTPTDPGGSSVTDKRIATTHEFKDLKGLTGFGDKEVGALRQMMFEKESGTKGYAVNDQVNGAYGIRYASNQNFGLYQYNENDVKDIHNKYFKDQPMPTREELLNNRELQDKYYEGYVKYRVDALGPQDRKTFDDLKAKAAKGDPEAVKRMGAYLSSMQAVGRNGQRAILNGADPRAVRAIGNNPNANYWADNFNKNLNKFGKSDGNSNGMPNQATAADLDRTKAGLQKQLETNPNLDARDVKTIRDQMARIDQLKSQIPDPSSNALGKFSTSKTTSEPDKQLPSENLSPQLAVPSAPQIGNVKTATVTPNSGSTGQMDPAMLSPGASGGITTKFSGGQAGSASNVTGYGKVNVKGAGFIDINNADQRRGQAFAGGNTHSGTLAAAQALSASATPGNVNRFTGFNDGYHKGTRSLHAKGLGGDFTVKDSSQSSAAAEHTRTMLKSAGLEEGKDFKVIDEYRSPSSRATGGHIHYQFNNADAAKRFSDHASTPEFQKQYNTLPPEAKVAVAEEKKLADKKAEPIEAKIEQQSNKAEKETNSASATESQSKDTTTQASVPPAQDYNADTYKAIPKPSGLSATGQGIVANLEKQRAFKESIARDYAPGGKYNPSEPKMSMADAESQLRNMTPNNYLPEGSASPIDMSAYQASPYGSASATPEAQSLGNERTQYSPPPTGEETAAAASTVAEAASKSSETKSSDTGNSSSQQSMNVSSDVVKPEDIPLMITDNGMMPLVTGIV